jgi:hypothetical protein
LSGGIAPIFTQRVVQCFISQRHGGTRLVREIGSIVPFNSVHLYSHVVFHNNQINITQCKAWVSNRWMWISKIFKVQRYISIESPGAVVTQNEILTGVDPHILQYCKILGDVGTSHTRERPSQQRNRRHSTIIQLEPFSTILGRRCRVSHNFVNKNERSRSGWWNTLIERSRSTTVTKTSGPLRGRDAPVATQRIVQCRRNQRHGGTLLIREKVSSDTPFHTIYFHAERIFHDNVVVGIIQSESTR